MKKILSLITILSFGCLYTNAQVTDGYYRVQTGKGNFISIVNNKIDNDNYNKVKAGGQQGLYTGRRYRPGAGPAKARHARKEEGL